MTVDELMTSALLLFMQGGKQQGLDYVSRSHTADMGWYFWLSRVPGVYEIELEKLGNDGNDADFYLRYYPDTEESVLEDFSVEEQLLRFDEKFFNDNEIKTDDEEHEICPCCSVPDMSHEHKKECNCDHHEHTKSCHCNELVHRKVGIPYLVKKFAMNKKMFMIGKLHIKVTNNVHKTSINTKERMIEKSDNGVSFMKDGQKIELIAPGGINRNVPGKELCNRFMEFFDNKLLSCAK